MGISTGVRFGVLERCNFSCFYCGLPAALGVVALQIEHVTPRALGGTDDPWNLVAACQPCNLGKTDTMPAEDLIEAAKQLYLTWPGRNRAAGQCSDCGRLWILNEDEIAAGGDQICAPCQSAWCFGYDVAAGRH